MPCDSIAIAVVALDEQGAWLLDQLQNNEPIQQALMTAIVQELQNALSDAYRVEAWPELRIGVEETSGYESKRISLKGRAPFYEYSRYTAPKDRAKFETTFADSMNAVAAQLVAELTRMDLEQSGYTITEDTIDNEGTRVINWQYEVTA